jgi:hypothetical protein
MKFYIVGVPPLHHKNVAVIVSAAIDYGTRPRKNYSAHGFLWIKSITLAHGRAMLDWSPELRRLRPAMRSNVGPALVSSHSRHRASSHCGGGPFGGRLSTW